MIPKRDFILRGSYFCEKYRLTIPFFLNRIIKHHDNILPTKTTARKRSPRNLWYLSATSFCAAVVFTATIIQTQPTYRFSNVWSRECEWEEYWGKDNIKESSSTCIRPWKIKRLLFLFFFLFLFLPVLLSLIFCLFLGGEKWWISFLCIILSLKIYNNGKRSLFHNSKVLKVVASKKREGHLKKGKDVQ